MQLHGYDRPHSYFLPLSSINFSLLTNLDQICQHKVRGNN